jgi:hypothetical protein
MLRAGLVQNLSDMRWYDGYFTNVRTNHLSPEELSFARWKIRREVIGMWKPTKGDWKYFKGYTYLWMFGLRYIIWLNERILELLFGIEGRYKLQMRHFMQLNNFGIDAPGLERPDSYHPVFATGNDPFNDTRWSLLKRRLSFAWRKLLAPSSTKPQRAQSPAIGEPAPIAEPVLQTSAPDTLVSISPARGK